MTFVNLGSLPWVMNDGVQPVDSETLVFTAKMISGLISSQFFCPALQSELSLFSSSYLLAKSGSLAGCMELGTVAWYTSRPRNS